VSGEWLAGLGLVSGDGAFYEDWRQEELTVALGQVQCRWAHGVELYDGLYALPQCPECGAAV
jgi:hypothetical protein